MLCLTRKLLEEIVIGGVVRLKVIDIGGGRVRFGIDAPPNISVRRSEVALKMSDYTRDQDSNHLLEDAA